MGRLMNIPEALVVLKTDQHTLALWISEGRLEFVTPADPQTSTQVLVPDDIPAFKATSKRPFFKKAPKGPRQRGSYRTRPMMEIPVNNGELPIPLEDRPNWMTLSEAAAELEKSKTEVRNLTLSHRLHARRGLIHRDSVSRYLRQFGR